MRPFRPLYINDANRWIDRAEQMLRNAEGCSTPKARRDCLLIAEQYQTIANQAQNRADIHARLALQNSGLPLPGGRDSGPRYSLGSALPPQPDRKGADNGVRPSLFSQD